MKAIQVHLSQLLLRTEAMVAHDDEESVCLDDTITFALFV